jgi:putative transport-related membrane protein
VKKLLRRSRSIVRDLFLAFRREAHDVLHDKGILVFLLAVPLLYPLFYSSIYMKENSREVPIVVIDQSHSALSREFLRRADATTDLRIVAHATDMATAREMLQHQKACGILYLPREFSRNLRSGRQATVSIYCDMSSPVCYQTILTSCTDVSLEMGEDIHINRTGYPIGKQEYLKAAPPECTSNALLNLTSGLAPFLIPAVLTLIIQQTLVLSIGMRNGSARESHRFHTQVAPRMPTGITTLLWGKALCYLIFCTVIGAWLLAGIPWLFRLTPFPQTSTLLAFLLPYLLACIFFAMTVSLLVCHRESCLLLFVPLSLPLLFISEVSWPGNTVPIGWQYVSWFFPSTFGINGFAKISATGARLKDVQAEYMALCLQAAFYFLTTWLAYRYMTAESRKVCTNPHTVPN